MEHDLTTGSVWKKLILFAIPIMGSNLLQAMYGTVDMIIVGRYADASAVSAVSTGSMLMQTVTGIMFGLTMGCTILLGQNIGRKDYKSASRTIGSTILLGVVLGILLAIVMVIIAVPVCNVMNAPAEAFSQTVSYFRICGIGSVCIVLFNSLSGMFRGIGDSKTPLILMGIACVCNIAGDILLVGALHMGAAGAAIATVAAQGVSVICAFLIIRKKGYGFPAVKEEVKPAKAELIQILKYGIPVGAQEALSGLSFSVILAVLNEFGLSASAGVGVGEKICGLMFIVHLAFMSAISAFSAQNVGAGNEERARTGMRCGMLIAFLFGAAMFLLSFFRGEILAGFFTPDAEIIAAAANYLKSYSIDSLFVAFNFSMMGYLNGRGNTLFVSIQGLLSTFVVRIPVTIFMSRTANASLFRVGLATPSATVFAIIITLFFMAYLKKKGQKKAGEGV